MTEIYLYILLRASLQVWEMNGASATLCDETKFCVEVASAELQHIPLFKGLKQQLSLQVGQFVGIASADGPMHLARIESDGEPGARNNV